MSFIEFPSLAFRNKRKGFFPVRPEASLDPLLVPRFYFGGLLGDSFNFYCSTYSILSSLPSFGRYCTDSYLHIYIFLRVQIPPSVDIIHSLLSWLSRGVTCRVGMIGLVCIVGRLRSSFLHSLSLSKMQSISVLRTPLQPAWELGHVFNTFALAVISSLPGVEFPFLIFDSDWFYL